MSDGQPFTAMGSSPADDMPEFDASGQTDATLLLRNFPRREDVAEWLPRLGPVLWLASRRHEALPPGDRTRRPQWRRDPSAIAFLSNYSDLRAHCVVTPLGPRESLCFHDAAGLPGAKLFLLPDSDLLAWDQMSSALHLDPVAVAERDPPTHATFLRRALSRSSDRWRARLLRFRSLPWPNALEAHPPLRISLLGLDIAQRMVRDENAEWASPLFSP